MADYIIVPNDVLVDSSEIRPKLSRSNTEESIEAGDSISINSTNGLLKKADMSNGDMVVGIALNNGAIGQPVDYLQSGKLVLGTGVGSVGDIVVQSAISGNIAPSEDLLVSDTVTIIGVFDTADSIIVNISNTGVIKV